MTAKTNVNIFSKEYYDQEKAKFEVQPGKVGKAEIEIVPKISGRIDGYMYKDFGVLENVSVFTIDGKLWMSLTPMEVQSHYFPINAATGRVGVAGLGMGYYVQRILDKPDVKEVVVYEVDSDTIELYKRNFGKHEKLAILQKDFHDIKGESFDFFYCDIYATQCDSAAIPDMAGFLIKNPNVDRYHFWTFEAMLLEIMHAGLATELPHSWLETYYPVLQQFFQSDKRKLANIRGCGEELYEAFVDAGLM